MADTTIKLKSGATLIVTPADFGQALALLKAVKKATFGLPDTASENDMTTAIITSEETEAAIFACAARAVYENVKVTPQLFNDPVLGEKARSDYFEICEHIIKVNTGAFFVHASSGSKGPSPTVQ